MLRSVRSPRARDRAGGPHLLGRQAVLRVRPGQRAVLPVPRRCLAGVVPEPSRAREGARGHHAGAPDTVLRSPYRVRGDAAGAGRRAPVRPRVGPALQLGGRAAPQGHLPAPARAVPAPDPPPHPPPGALPPLHPPPPPPRSPPPPPHPPPRP